MILEAILLAQLTGTMHECVAAGGFKYFATDCDGILSNGTTITNSASPQPSCPDGYTMISDLLMHPKCAKDIIEPIYK